MAFPLVFGPLLSAINVETAAAQDESAAGDGQDPVDVARALIEADNRGDLDAALAFYAVDAELWPPGEPPVRGRQAIESRYREIFAAARLDLHTRIEKVRAAEDWALVAGEVRGTAAPKDGSEPTQVDDKYLMVLERTDGGAWRITRLMWSPSGGDDAAGGTGKEPDEN